MANEQDKDWSKNNTYFKRLEQRTTQFYAVASTITSPDVLGVGPTAADAWQDAVRRHGRIENMRAWPCSADLYRAAKTLGNNMGELWAYNVQGFVMLVPSWAGEKPIYGERT